MSLLMNWLESMHIDPTITNKCSRKRNRRSTCSICSEVCRNGSLSITEESIDINLEICTSCGDCMIACPLSAIKGIPSSREMNQDSLIYSETYTPSVKELLLYKKRGLNTISVNSSKLNEDWAQTIKEANFQLSLLDQTALEVISKSDEKTFSRRGLFTSIQKEGKQLAKSLAPASWKMGANEWTLSNFYPEHQFNTVEIDIHTCILCQACFSLCSQDVFQVLDGSIQIEHQRCVNCRDCQDICPEEAIHITPEIKRKSLSQLDYYTFECLDCKKSFQTFQKDQDTCPICFQRDPGWLSPYE